MKIDQLTASKFRVILIVSLVLILGIGAGVFIFTSGNLKKAATEASRATVDAEASSSNLQTLQTIEKDLEARKDTVERTKQIVAESKSYQYQDQIITDITKYASIAQIGITNIDFGSPDGASTESSGAAVAPTPTPEAGGSIGAPAAAAPSSVKTTSVSITLDNPVEYNNLLRFIRLIEQNLTKMQISRIGISSDGESREVTSDTLTIEVYIR